MATMLKKKDWSTEKRRALTATEIVANLAKLLYATYPGRGRVDVCLHGVARSWAITSSAAGARVESLELRSAGRDFVVRAHAQKWP